MKKILILAALCSALIVSVFGGTTASAATAKEDDYNAYIVATGAECLTEYYTQIGDGNATVTFDLQWRSESGYFGVVAGDSQKLGKLSALSSTRKTARGRSIKRVFAKARTLLRTF